MTDSSFNKLAIVEKIEKHFLIFGKLVRRKGLPFFVCGPLRKFVKFPGVPSYNLDSPTDSCNGQDSQDGPDKQNSQNGQNG